MNVLTETWICLFFVISFFSSVVGRACVQCWSMMEPGCVEGDMEPRECPGEGEQFCIKYVGVTKPMPMVLRSCNPIAVKNECSIKLIQGHRIKVCYETCNTDGCNGGAAVGRGATAAAGAAPGLLILTIALLAQAFPAACYGNVTPLL